MKQGRAVMLIHGYATDIEDYNSIIPYLKERYDHIELKNLPGHGTGASKLKGFSVESTIDMVNEQAEYLIQNYQTVDLIGFSMGGAIATYLGCKYKFNKIVLLAPANKYVNVRFGWKKLKYHFDYLSNMYRSKGDPAKRKQIETQAKETQINDRKSAEMAFKQLLPNYTIQTLSTFVDIAEYCNKYIDNKIIKCPVLLLWGTLDQLVPKTTIEFVKDHSNAILVHVVENISHLMLNSDNNQELIDYTLSFLDGKITAPKVSYSDMAKLICPNVKHNVLYYERKFKARKVEQGAMVTRFAPSPTGFLHTGSLYTALVNYKFAKDTNGIFYLRIEDTDTKRTVHGSMDILKKQLEDFDITYDNDEHYGPYVQSERKDIYDTVLYELICNGYAYPCFCTKEDLDKIRIKQMEAEVRTGYYKEYAKCRKISIAMAMLKIKKGVPYIVRLKSTGNFENHFTFHDEIRGDIQMSENDFDVVLRKSDGLPTYHFAHVCDDHFMRTTHVIRGEEWLSSIPVHKELFDKCGFEMPKYIHLGCILKQDGDKKRKLSKRLDQEASVSYFLNLGYPEEAIKQYLLCIANSKYEDHIYEDYKLDIHNFSSDGALFDMDKLNFLSKNYLASLPAEEFYKGLRAYANQYNFELRILLIKSSAYIYKIICIGRDVENPRKDYTCYSEFLTKNKFFFAEYFSKLEYEALDYPKETIDAVLKSFMKNDKTDPNEWVQFLKDEAYNLSFAKNKKEKEALGLNYIFSDYMKIVRITLCKKNESPDLFEVCKILGQKEIKKRINYKLRH